MVLNVPFSPRRHRAFCGRGKCESRIPLSVLDFVSFKNRLHQLSEVFCTNHYTAVPKPVANRYRARCVAAQYGVDLSVQSLATMPSSHNRRRYGMDVGSLVLPDLDVGRSQRLIGGAGHGLPVCRSRRGGLPR